MRTRNRYSNNKKNKHSAKHTIESENYTYKTKRILPLSVITKVLVIVILLIGILNINNIFAYLTKFISNVNIFTINATYTVTYDSNGGSGTIPAQNISYNVATNLYSNENRFVKNGSVFAGWNTEPDGSGTSYSEGQQVTNIAEDNVTLYARWRKVIKYAVQVYGINEDVDVNGDSLGVTFGPAVGNNGYIYRYVTHSYEETSSGSGEYYVKINVYYANQNGGESIESSTYLTDKDGNRVVRTEQEKNKYDVSIHNLTWAQIAALPDKTVLTDCMLCGDTKSVELTLNSALETSSSIVPSGDGMGMITESINGYYRKWNPAPSENSAVGTGVTLDANEQWMGSNARNAGGYKTSHIRASLIGADVSNPTIGYAGDDNLTSANCIFSCIESDLRNAIVAKKVKYATGTNYTEGNYTINDDIADKIWLLSAREIYGTATSSGGSGEGIGANGDGYGKFSNPQSSYYTSSYTDNYCNTRAVHSEGSASICWLRSEILNSTHHLANLDAWGRIQNLQPYNTYGIAFGFCLASNKYTVEFDANGGTGTPMPDMSMTCGIAQDLTANTYTRTNYEFVGWNTAADGSGTSYTDEQEVNNLSVVNNDTVTLYAQWYEKPKVKYAVQIYGINQDEDADGNPLGLTFGPATGANYNNSYVTHTYEETSQGSGEYYVKIVTHNVASDGTETTTDEYLTDSSSNNVTRTAAQVSTRQNINLHTMTWTEIAQVPDKTVFEDCMLCGDTKSVELTLNNTIASGNTYNQYGDGAGTLVNTINSYYRRWNPSQSQNSYVGTGVTLDSNERNYGSNARNAGGYSVSHIRATLIGENTKTNQGYAGDVNLSSDTCLYSCIEDDLKQAITPKKIKYVTGTGVSNYTLNDDIADKIWLFSVREIYGTGATSGNETEGLGSSGDGYAKFSNTESKYYISSYNISNNTNRVVYHESRSTGSRWLRSPYLSHTYRSHYVNTNGRISDSDADFNYGLDFGFCIPAAKYEVEFDSNGGTGTMANQIMTCGVQQSLTANTFTREGYEFVGWNTSPGGNGTSYTDEQAVLNLSLTNNSTIKLYAQWTRTMRTKYAVQIYGINQDEDSDGNTLGLTFGPALGDNYNHKYVTHTYEETSSGSGEYYVRIVTHTVAADNSETTSSEYLKDSSNNNVVRTADQVASRLTINLHDMTWAQIAAVPDKTVFEDCMLCGDTKSITLYMNSTISNQCEYNQYGDGGGTIWSTINKYYLMWNPSYSQNTAIGTGVSFDSDEYNYGSNAGNAGGYTVSNIRSTLIGKENSNYVVGYAGDRNLTEKNCLYSCIESDLKNLIVAKKIKYVTGTATNNYTLNTDIADKIWLFSDREINGTGQYSGYDTEGVGSNGTGYAKFANTESKYYLSTYTDNTNSKRTCHSEYGSNYGFWLRSPIISNSSAVRAIKGSGDLFNNSPYYYNIGVGINFGFCLPAASYEVEFDSNGGTGTMANQSMTCGVAKELSANTYTRTGYEFAGWNTAADGSGTSYSDEEEVNNLSIIDNSTVRLYAQWREIPKVKYAVQIYGINQDEDADGNPLGLTFGPATGADYNNSYVTHTYEETSQGSGEYYVKIVTHNVASDGTETTTDEYLTDSSSNNVTRTAAQVSTRQNINLHTMTWTEIAQVPDKTVFEDCMLCGDTKSVTIYLSGPIASGNSYNQYGDGAGKLNAIFDDYYLRWNPAGYLNAAVTNTDSYSYYNGSNGSRADGYKASHLRATLIGESADTDVTYAGDVNLSSSNSLYSCIESEVRDVITSKRIKYVTGTNVSNYSTNSDIVDSIWALSEREMYGTAMYSGYATEGIGTSGVAYDKFTNTESKYYISNGPTDSNTACRITYTERGFNNGTSAWLRTGRLDDTGTSRLIADSGRPDNSSPNNPIGLNFGFCIPSASYEIEFDSNGGTGTMASQTMTCGVQKSLTANTFTRSGYEFAGWNTAANASGTSYTDEQDVLNLSLTNNDTVTLYAQWTELPKVKYAVQIYGINQDVDASGNPLGLTFGPAVGANYNNSYVTHEYEETSEGSGEYYVKIITHTVASNGSETTSSAYLTDSSSNNVTRTAAQVSARENISLHDMTWTEIAAVSDKTVFEDCMLCGDTKSVTLSLNSTIASGSGYNQYGDGAGMLINAIKNRTGAYYKNWNPNTSQNAAATNGGSTGSNARDAGGYSTSHIRATLIGENTKTDVTYAGDVNLDENTCLYSCIESDLQAVITPKKIKYVTGTGTGTGSYSLNDDIADSIWLFSDREMYGTGQYSGNTTEGLGASGDGYNKFGNTESKYYISSYNTSANTNRAAYDQSGSANNWWLRSPYLSGTYSARYVRYNGSIVYSDAYGGSGLAFGFCIQ